MMACRTLSLTQDNIVTVLQAAKKRGLAGRVIWGMTPVVTYPVSALSNKMLSGIPTCTSFVRNISAVAKLVGRGMKDYGIPGYDNCLAPLCENMQAIRIKVKKLWKCCKSWHSGCITCIVFRSWFS